MAKHPGQILREARNARSLSLEKVSRETRIRQHHLQAIEDGDLTVLPSEAQARGFIRVYAQYLGLQPDALSLAGDHQDDPAPQLLAADRAAAPPPPDGELKSAQEIFAEIGQQLRQQREILGFSLDDVEGQIHVRTHYLKAIEAGEVSRLPSPVQGRGMLSNYTSFLGLDSDAVLLRFADGLQAQLAAKKAAQTRPSSRRRLTLPRRLRWILSGDLIFGGIIISLLIGFFIWGAVRITSMRAQEQIPPTAPSLVELLRPSPSAPPAELTPTSNAAEQVGSQLTTTPEATVLELPELPDAAVQVQIVVRQRAWMRVIVDGQTAFEGRVLPGAAYPFSGDESVEIQTGNGAGLQVLYNQQDLGTLGIYGEVVNRIFAAEGILTATPTLTPTSTATPRTTATPTAPGNGTTLQGS